MSDKKRCSGYKGHHVCANEYPDHMVPKENLIDTQEAVMGYKINAKSVLNTAT